MSTLNNLKDLEGRDDLENLEQPSTLELDLELDLDLQREATAAAAAGPSVSVPSPAEGRLTICSCARRRRRCCRWRRTCRRGRQVPPGGKNKTKNDQRGERERHTERGQRNRQLSYETSTKPKKKGNDWYVRVDNRQAYALCLAIGVWGWPGFDPLGFWTKIPLKVPG